MALDDREYARERYRLPERKKREIVAKIRRRFDVATPKAKRRRRQIEIPMPELPESPAAMLAIAGAIGLAAAAVIIGVVSLIA